jgi:thiol-disulfide isomerase/thioredoxin
MRWISVLVVIALMSLSGCAGDSSSPAEEAGETVAASGQAPTSPAPSPSGSDEEPAEDEPAPAAVPAELRFTGMTLAGDAFDGATLAGKPVVLWFWAPWCPTCRAQIPNVTALADEYHGRVTVVGVGGLDSQEAIVDLAEQIPHVTHLVDHEGEVWRHFGVTEQSTYTVISADGEVVSEGYLDDADLTDLVAELAA